MPSFEVVLARSFLLTRVIFPRFVLPSWPSVFLSSHCCLLDQGKIGPRLSHDGSAGLHRDPVPSPAFELARLQVATMPPPPPSEPRSQPCLLRRTLAFVCDRCSGPAGKVLVRTRRGAAPCLCRCWGRPAWSRPTSTWRLRTWQRAGRRSSRSPPRSKPLRARRGSRLGKSTANLTRFCREPLQRPVCGEPASEVPWHGLWPSRPLDGPSRMSESESRPRSW